MLTYRHNVAVFVIDKVGRILLCERLDVADAWQLPQGGIELDETPQQAMFRELSEEIGTDRVEVIAQLPYSIRYEWPERLWDKGFRGQEQEYFLVRLQEDAEIDLSGQLGTPEFRSCRWVVAMDFQQIVGGFKRQAYLQALNHFREFYPNIIKEQE